MYVHSAKNLSLSVYVDDLKMSGKTENIRPMWEALSKHLKLDPPTPLHDSVYLGCQQHCFKPADSDIEKQKIVVVNKAMLEQQGAMEKASNALSNLGQAASNALPSEVKEKLPDVKLPGDLKLPDLPDLPGLPGQKNKGPPGGFDD